MKLLIALLVALSLFFILAYILLKGEDNTVQKRVSSLRDKRIPQKEMTISQMKRQRIANKSLYDRFIKPRINVVGNVIAMATPKSVYEEIVEEVNLSGGFFGYKLAGFLIFNFFTLALSVGVALIYNIVMDKTFLQDIMNLSIGIVFGLFFPRVVLRAIIKDRQAKIRASMPDVMDILCVSVQAGLSFDMALNKLVSKMKGPLINEFEHLLQELRMGVTRRNALNRLAKRCGIQEMQLFTAAIIQADRLGVGIAQVLEIQAENMREQRMARAKELAAKLPVKILFPTIIFIFPVIFIVVLAPALVSIMTLFK